MGATRASTPAVCPVCNKTICRKADLPRHMRTHATNKEDFMHSCPYEGCDYKALQRSNVVTHIRTHTGERPNKCPTPGCTYATSDPGSLTRHRKVAHDYEPKAQGPSRNVRKTKRQQRRVSPYPSVSPSPSEFSASSSSSSDAFDHPELAKLLEEPIPLDFTDAVKNISPAYNSILLLKSPEYNSPFIVPADPEFDFTFNSSLSPSQEVAWLGGSSCLYNLGDMADINEQPVYPIAGPTSSNGPIPDSEFSYSPLVSKERLLASPPPALSLPPPEFSFDNGYVAPCDVNAASFDDVSAPFPQWQPFNDDGYATYDASSLPTLPMPYDDACFSGAPSCDYDSWQSSYAYPLSTSESSELLFQQGFDFSSVDTVNVSSGAPEFFFEECFAY